MYEKKIDETVADINKVKEQKKQLDEIEQRLLGRLITLQELQQEAVDTSDESK